MRFAVLPSVMLLAALTGAAEAKVYQRLVNLSCSSNACIGGTPKVPEGKTLTVSSLSCANSPAGSGAVGIVSIANSSSFVQYLRLEPTVSSFATNGVEQVAITVRSGRQLALALALGSGQVATSATCGVRGKLQ